MMRLFKSFVARSPTMRRQCAAIADAPHVRVVLAEDEGLLREGLARLLTDAGFEVIGKAGDAAALLRLVDARLPDVVLTDIRMPPGHSDEGLVAAEQIRDRHPQIGVLVLSHHVDSRYAMRLLESYPQRSGYLLKERVSEVAVLSDALRRIGEGECVIDPTIVSRLMSRGEHGGADVDALVRDQREVRKDGPAQVDPDAEVLGDDQAVAAQLAQPGGDGGRHGLHRALDRGEPAV